MAFIPRSTDSRILKILEHFWFAFLDIWDAPTKSITVNVTENSATKPIYVAPSDGIHNDAFQRLRVGAPQTLFDSQFTYGINPVLYDQSTANGATITHDTAKRAAALTVTSTIGSKAILQQHGYSRYQPGKSQEIFITFSPASATGGATFRAGYFDAFNGMFFQGAKDGNIEFVIRSSVSGSVVDTVIDRADWNIDKLDGSGPSGQTLNLSATQILVIDFQALYAGRVRFGFDIGGLYVPCHQKLHANILSVPYIADANLPVRWELEQTAAGDGCSMLAMCTTVVTNGGNEVLGFPFSVPVSPKKTVGITEVPIMAIRPKLLFNSIANRGRVENVLLEASGYGDRIIARARYRPTLTNASWVSCDAQSIVEYDVSATAFSGGQIIASTVIDSQAANAAAKTARTSVSNALSKLVMALNIAGDSSDILLITLQSDSADDNGSAMLSWIEVR